VTSIYERALGPDFGRLHPQIQKRFDFSSTDGVASLGQGVMEEIWRGPFYTLPFLYIGTWRRIMFPDRGHNVPFTIENYAYVDGFGRETVTWVRRFQTKRPRRFDAYMIFSQQRGQVIDYLGSHQHLAVDIELSVDERGGLRLRSDEQRFYEGPLAFKFPLFFSGIANVCEWYDDVHRKYRIQVAVTNRLWGDLFGYRGSFDVVWKSLSPREIPPNVLPQREERRE
jgi:hypothetical protein